MHVAVMPPPSWQDRYGSACRTNGAGGALGVVITRAGYASTGLNATYAVAANASLPAGAAASCTRRTPQCIPRPLPAPRAPYPPCASPPCPDSVTRPVVGPGIGLVAGHVAGPVAAAAGAAAAAVLRGCAMRAMPLPQLRGRRCGGARQAP